LAAKTTTKKKLPQLPPPLLPVSREFLSEL
jgi:hypothetical protein